MNPGSLNKRVVFKENKRIPDGAGGFKSNWVDKFTCWANLKTLTPQQRTYMETTTTFFPVWLIIRKDNNKAPKVHMKAFVEGREYNIISIRDYAPDNKYLEIEAKELAP